MSEDPCRAVVTRQNMTFEPATRKLVKLISTSRRTALNPTLYSPGFGFPGLGYTAVYPPI